MTAGNTTVGVAVTALSIGQRVRLPDHHDRRVTGTVRALAIEDNALMATIALDEPIVIPARGDGDREIRLYTQHVPAHELAPFDERDELVDELVRELRRLLAAYRALARLGYSEDDAYTVGPHNAIAKATGGAA